LKLFISGLKDENQLCFETNHFLAHQLDHLIVQKIQFCIFTAPIKIILFVFKRLSPVLFESKIYYFVFEDDHQLCFETDHFLAHHLAHLIVQKINFAFLQHP
jgi:hypothetical protein